MVPRLAVGLLLVFNLSGCLTYEYEHEFWLRVDPDDIPLVKNVLKMMESENPADGPEPLRCSECNAKLDPRDRLCLRCGTTIADADDA